MKIRWMTSLLAALIMALLIGCGRDSAESPSEPISGFSGTEDEQTVIPDLSDVADAADEIPETESDSSEPIQEETVDALELDAELTDAEASKPLADLVINEVVVKAVENGPDWIEIHNLGGTKADLEGWGIRDELNAHEYLFPAGAEIPAGGYFVVWGKNSGFEYEMDYQFKVDAKARLFAPDGETLVDEADWEDGDAPAGTSWGRFPNGVGAFQTLTTPTQGKVNQEPESEQEETDVESSGNEDGLEGPEPPPAPKLRVNEVYAIDPEGANCWVEIFNPREEEVDLDGWYVNGDPFGSAPVGISGPSIPAEGFVVLECNVDFPFVLTANGQFWLMNNQGLKEDSGEWTEEQVPAGQSYGRLPDGGDEWVTFPTPTVGESNTINQP